jgi:DNA-binding transcriptional ArsR family regulator
LTTVSPPVMSRHLRILLRIGIIDDERSPVDARVRLFYLRREALAPLASWLERTQTHWSHELASF